MRIVFFSTNTNHFDGNIIHINSLPLCSTQLEQLQKRFPEHQFIIAAQKPGIFLLDLENEELLCKAQGVEYRILQGKTTDEFAAEILELKPDFAAAASFWVTPFDWLTVQDSLIAEKLRRAGIKTCANPADTSLLCFDKKTTHDFLVSNKFNCAKAVFVNHELFFCERNRHEVNHNIYKEAVLEQIKALHFPVIIKDTTGLSSYGMDVCTTFNQAQAVLCSKRNNGNRLVEEFLEGFQFGCEIYGSCGKYTVCNPFMFSVNQYGITSPKQSVKIGPVTNEKFCIKRLKKDLMRLAAALQFEGIAQVDLVFSRTEKKWYIIEINPRLSGMSQMNAVAMGRSIFDLMLGAAAVGRTVSDSAKERSEQPYIMDFKLPPLTKDQMQAIYDMPYVEYLNQTFNNAASQRREMGFCEIVIKSEKSFDQLKIYLDDLKQKWPELIEPAFYEKAVEIIKLPELP